MENWSLKYKNVKLNNGKYMQRMITDQIYNMAQRQDKIEDLDADQQQLDNQKDQQGFTFPNRKRLRNGRTKITDYWLGPKSIGTSNSFQELEKQTQEKEGNKIDKPPSIFVNNVYDIQPLINTLNEIAPNEYSLKCIDSNKIRIQTSKPEVYTNVIRALEQKNTQFHTYQLKSDRTFRVVLRGLHQSTATDEIKSELGKLNHTVLHIANMTGWRTRNGKRLRENVPLFSLELKSNENNKDIYELTRLLHTVVKFETPTPKKTIPQCKKCQEFGHTHKYCHKEARCVKCDGAHATKDCTRKQKDAKVFCVNCRKYGHPANYGGCEFLQKLKNKSFPANRPQIPPPGFKPSSMRLPNTLYSEVLQSDDRGTEQSKAKIKQNNSEYEARINKLEEKFDKMMERIDKMFDTIQNLVKIIAK